MTGSRLPTNRPPNRRGPADPQHRRPGGPAGRRLVAHEAGFGPAGIVGRSVAPAVSDLVAGIQLPPESTTRQRELQEARQRVRPRRRPILTPEAAPGPPAGSLSWG